MKYDDFKLNRVTIKLGLTSLPRKIGIFIFKHCNELPILSVKYQDCRVKKIHDTVIMEDAINIFLLI
jgi:hypothetical protein